MQFKKANYSFELRNARSKYTSITIVTTELVFTLKSAYLYVNQWHLDTVYLIESQHGELPQVTEILQWQICVNGGS